MPGFQRGAVGLGVLLGFAYGVPVLAQWLGRRLFGGRALRHEGARRARTAAIASLVLALVAPGVTFGIMTVWSRLNYSGVVRRPGDARAAFLIGAGVAGLGFPLGVYGAALAGG